jgi:hypothetical protein
VTELAAEKRSVTSDGASNRTLANAFDFKPLDRTNGSDPISTATNEAPLAADLPGFIPDSVPFDLVPFDFVPIDPFEETKARAERGETGAQLEVAFRYYRGDGVATNL